MTLLTTSMVREVHRYTQDDSPWIIVNRGIGEKGRLVHYIAGGGMKSFGRTLAQDIARRKHRAFKIVAAVLALGWLAGLVI